MGGRNRGPVTGGDSFCCFYLIFNDKRLTLDAGSIERLVFFFSGWHRLEGASDWMCLAVTGDPARSRNWAKVGVGGMSSDGGFFSFKGTNAIVGIML